MNQIIDLSSPGGDAPSSETGVVLKHQDCISFLQGLEPGSVALALLDPPYEISRQTGFQSCKTGVSRFAVSMDFGEWDHAFTEMAQVMELVYRALKPGGTAIVFYDLWKISHLSGYFSSAGFKQQRLLEWLKTNPVPLNSKKNYLTNSREIAVSGVKGRKPTFNSEYDNGVYHAPICHEKGRFHPTQKPLSLIRDLVLKHSNPGDLVLDCFSGSGTTAVAAALSGRSFTGCELDPVFHQKSLERLALALATGTALQ